MNRKIASIAVAFAALSSVAAHAVDAGSSPFAQKVESNRTRAEVTAEAIASRNGPNYWSSNYNPLKNFKSTRDAADVRAEAVAAASDSAVNGEGPGAAVVVRAKTSAPASQLAGTPTRAAY